MNEFNHSNVRDLLDRYIDAIKQFTFHCYLSVKMLVLRGQNLINEYKKKSYETCL